MLETGNIESVPHAHRLFAADLLAAKADKLADYPVTFGDNLEKAQILKNRQAVSLYDIAISLLESYHARKLDYLESRSMALSAIKQYSKARSGYEEIIRVIEDTNRANHAVRSTDNMRSRVKELQGLQNEELDPLNENHQWILKEPEFCEFAEQFCELLSKGKYEDAISRLSTELADVYKTQALQAEWLELVENKSEKIRIILERYEESDEDDEIQFSGWCYFTVEADYYLGSIALSIFRNKKHDFEIREIKFD